MKKQLLIISPKFFGYEAEIVREVVNLGYDCDWFDDRPSNGFFTKALLRLNYSFFIAIGLTIHRRRLRGILKKFKYDTVLIINPEATDEETLLMIRDVSGARIVSYFWDSVANKKKFKRLLPLVDKAFSFDPKDSCALRIEYLPLFYVRCFKEVGLFDLKRKFDLSFIGTLHSDRYKFVNNVINDLKVRQKSLRVFTFFYCPSFFLFIWRKYVTREFKIIPWREVSFRSLSLTETAEILKASNFTIDIAHKGQSGFTMRTFEAAAAGCRLIGNMNSVAAVELPWLHYADITDVLSITDLSFSEVNKIQYREEDLAHYSLNSWLQRVLSE